MAPNVNAKAFDPSTLKMRFGPNPEDVVSIDIESLEVGGVPVWGPDGLHKDLAAKLINVADAKPGTVLNLEDRGIHSLRDGRVVGVEIAMPEGELKQAVDNAFITDTRLNNPMSALKQYDRALKRVAPDDFTAKMIIHNRAGLAMNHLVKERISLKLLLDPDLAKETEQRLQESIDVAEAHGIPYGAPHFNLATLYAMLGMTKKGLESLEQAIEADPAVFEELAKKDSDLAPLAGAQFTRLVEGKLAERRELVENELFQAAGGGRLLGRLRNAEMLKLKVGASNHTGPSFGIELAGDVYLTAHGLRALNRYDSDTTEGSSYVALSSEQLKQLNIPELQAEIGRLAQGEDLYAYTMASHSSKTD